jgi:hypothetical protein
LPIPAGLPTQWETIGASPLRNRVKRQSLVTADAVLAGDFPERILNKAYVRCARLLHRLGLRDYGYAFRAAGLYHRYWKACAGHFVLPTGDAA